MLVIVVPSTTVTDTVVICVYVSRLVGNGNVVSAYSIVPVIGLIKGPSIIVGVLVIVVPRASVALAIVVLIIVKSLFGRLNVMGTGGIAPVENGVEGPFFRIGVHVIVVPSASVTDAVCVYVIVRGFVFGFNVVSAGNRLPVVNRIVRPFCSIGVLVVEVPLTKSDVTDSVVICIGMRAFNRNGTLIALEVTVCVCVLGAFNCRVTLITKKVSVFVYVLFAEE
jgi:hypothetical protein